MIDEVTCGPVEFLPNLCLSDVGVGTINQTCSSVFVLIGTSRWSGHKFPVNCPRKAKSELALHDKSVSIRNSFNTCQMNNVNASAVDVIANVQPFFDYNTQQQYNPSQCNSTYPP